MAASIQDWFNAMGTPESPIEPTAFALSDRYDFPEFTCEVWRCRDAQGKSQRMMMAIPKKAAFPCPAVAVPFYYPESMLGLDPAAGEPIPEDAPVAMMLHLVKRGYITASSDAYHLTFRENPRKRDDFARWKDAAAALREEHPNWSGIGKLVSDTRLLLDLLEKDSRTDAARIGIAGHSLGGKMAFYTGCLDPRVKAILASDFGFGWEQSNWRDSWYWDSRVDSLAAAGMDHTQLLGLASPKPFCLIAGEYDTKESGKMMRRAAGYAPGDERLKIINHATGHRPPAYALEEGYRFLDRWM